MIESKVSNGFGLARIKAREGGGGILGKISHVEPNDGRIAILGTAWIWANIIDSTRFIIYDSTVHDIESSMGNPNIGPESETIKRVLLREGEIIRFNLKPGEHVGRNNVKSVIAV